MPLVLSAGNNLAPRRAWLRRYTHELLAAAILLVMAGNLVSIVVRKSITADEVVLIPSAYYHFVADEVHLIGQHPPLCKLRVGLQWLSLQPNDWKPERTDPAARGAQHQWNYSSHF